VPATAAALLPGGLDPVDAASVPLNALTAAQMLDRLGPPDGRTLLVTGAAGAVGGYAVALAAHAGWTVTARWLLTTVIGSCSSYCNKGLTQILKSGRLYSLCRSNVSVFPDADVKTSVYGLC
jgi:hypothetical protein